jgi:hypothetical protein
MLARAHGVETTDTTRGAGKGTQATHSVAAAERLDIEEGEDLFALEKLEGGNITCIAIGHVSRHLRRARPRSGKTGQA